jgi:uncharacterized membrane protein
MSPINANPLEEEIFAARLSPYRSLPRRNLRIVMILFGIASFITCLPFVMLGAWPILSYMALDTLMLYLAFRANYSAARAYEQIHLTPLELRLARVSARGARTEWRFNPVWVRLERQEDEEFGTARLALVSGGKRVEIAGFLGPDQKAQLADALGRALATARRGARFS